MGNLHVWEMYVQNRVVKKETGRPISRAQGTWYIESISVVAESAAEAEQFVRAEIRRRPVLGMNAACRRRVERQVKFLSVERSKP